MSVNYSKSMLRLAKEAQDLVENVRALLTSLRMKVKELKSNLDCGMPDIFGTGLRKIDTKKSLAVRIIATPAIEAFLKCLIELETASEEAHGRCYDMIVSYNEFSEEEFERGKKAGREEAEEDFKDRLEQAEKVAEDIGRDNAYEDPDFIPDPLKDELEELYTEVQDNCNPCPRTGIGGTYGEEGTSVCVVPEPCSFYVIRKRVDKTLSKRGY